MLILHDRLCMPSACVHDGRFISWRSECKSFDARRPPSLTLLDATDRQRHGCLMVMRAGPTRNHSPSTLSEARQKVSTSSREAPRHKEGQGGISGGATLE
jgi:hypothetical protein